LAFSEIESSILPPPLCLDDSTADYVQMHRRNMQEFRLAKVNTNLDEFKHVWPEGTPINFFIAFSLCDSDHEVTKERLREPAFIRLVLAQTAASGYGGAQVRVAHPIRTRPRAERTDADRIRQLTQPYATGWLPATRRRLVSAYHERIQEADAERDLKPISPLDVDGDVGDLTLTFLKGDRRVSVGNRLPEDDS
jgi:hypothetical protein